jgi:hypothetical protein
VRQYATRPFLVGWMTISGRCVAARKTRETPSHYLASALPSLSSKALVATSSVIDSSFLYSQPS